MGINCEICEDGFYRPSGVSHNSPDACHPCLCDVIGSTGLCFKDDADEHLGIVSQLLANSNNNSNTITITRTTTSLITEIINIFIITITI